MQINIDGLYWWFIEKHRDYFSGNPLLALMRQVLDHLDADRRSRMF